MRAPVASTRRSYSRPRLGSGLGDFNSPSGDEVVPQLEHSFPDEQILALRAQLDLRQNANAEEVAELIAVRNACVETERGVNQRRLSWVGSHAEAS